MPTAMAPRISTMMKPKLKTMAKPEIRFRISIYTTTEVQPILQGLQPIGADMTVLILQSTITDGPIRIGDSVTAAIGAGIGV